MAVKIQDSKLKDAKTLSRAKRNSRVIFKKMIDFLLLLLLFVGLCFSFGGAPPRSADWRETLRQTHNRWQENCEADALHGLQLTVRDGGPDVVSGKKEAEVVRLRLKFKRVMI